MTEDDLARKLREAYLKAPNRDKALHMMLFAIEFHDQLLGHNSHTLCELAQIPKWGPQLNLGRKLAPYVKLNS